MIVMKSREISKEQVNISISEEKESVPPLSVEDIKKASCDGLPV